MTDKNILSVQKRDVRLEKAKQLRKQGMVPANIFGDGEASVSVSLDKKELVKTLGGVGETPLFYLKMNEKAEIPVLVDELQYHVISNDPIHVSFKRVNLREKVSSEIPVELVGGNEVSGAVVVLALNSIEVEALPADLPEKFELDVSKLTETGQSMGYSDLLYDKNKVQLLVEEEKLEEPIVLLQEVKEEVVEEPVEPKEDVKAEGEEGKEESKKEDSDNKEGREDGGEDSEKESKSSSKEEK
ncbi:MAG: 50S ribosomal protein L25 [Patescibacteria group bacterium]